MPMRCVVGGCSNVAKDGFSLHLFPKDEIMRRKWNAKMKLARPAWSGPSESSVICSAHFNEDDDFERGLHEQFGIPRKRTLKSSAVPTIQLVPGKGPWGRGNAQRKAELDLMPKRTKRTKPQNLPSTMMTCVIAGCSQIEEPCVRFLHALSDDLATRGVWRSIVRETYLRRGRGDICEFWDRFPRSCFYICSDHFIPTDYENWEAWTMGCALDPGLKACRVPSVGLSPKMRRDPSVESGAGNRSNAAYSDAGSIARSELPIWECTVVMEDLSHDPSSVEVIEEPLQLVSTPEITCETLPFEATCRYPELQTEPNDEDDGSEDSLTQDSRSTNDVTGRETPCELRDNGLEKDSYDQSSSSSSEEEAMDGPFYDSAGNVTVKEEPVDPSYDYDEEKEQFDWSSISTSSDVNDMWEPYYETCSTVVVNQEASEPNDKGSVQSEGSGPSGPSEATFEERSCDVHVSEQASTSKLVFKLLPERNAKINTLTNMIEKWIVHKQKENKTENRQSRKKNGEDVKADQTVNPLYIVRETVPNGDEGGATFQINTLDCICNKKDFNQFLIPCHHCSAFYHAKCVGVSESISKQIEIFICPLCRGKNPSLQIIFKKDSILTDREKEELLGQMEVPIYFQSKQLKKKKKRTDRACKMCKPCLRTEDCKKCDFCLDQARNGGPAKIRQKCRLRQCQQMGLKSSNYIEHIEQCNERSKKKKKKSKLGPVSPNKHSSTKKQSKDERRSKKKKKKKKKTPTACGKCKPCKRTEDCDKCDCCLDAQRNGGPRRIRLKCRFRQCKRIARKKQTVSVINRSCYLRTPTGMQWQGCGDCAYCRRVDDCGVCMFCRENQENEKLDKRNKKPCLRKLCNHGYFKQPHPVHDSASNSSSSKKCVTQPPIIMPFARQNFNKTLTDPHTKSIRFPEKTSLVDPSSGSLGEFEKRINKQVKRLLHTYPVAHPLHFHNYSQRSDYLDRIWNKHSHKLFNMVKRRRRLRRKMIKKKKMKRLREEQRQERKEKKKRTEGKVKKRTEGEVKKIPKGKVKKIPEVKAKVKVNDRNCVRQKRTVKSCKECEPCRKKTDCGRCKNCLDKSKFGGDDIKRQKCILRQCVLYKGKKYVRLKNTKYGDIRRRCEYREEMRRSVLEASSRLQPLQKPPQPPLNIPGKYVRRDKVPVAYKPNWSSQLCVRSRLGLRHRLQRRLPMSVLKKASKSGELAENHEAAVQKLRLELEKKKTSLALKQKVSVLTDPMRTGNCYNRGCTNARVGDRKYCSHGCEVNVTTNLLIHLLTKRLKQWQKFSFLKLEDKDTIHVMEHDVDEVKQQVMEVNAKVIRLQRISAKARATPASAKCSSSDEKDGKDNRVSCPVCSTSLDPKTAYSHFTKCGGKDESGLAQFFSKSKAVCETKLTKFLEDPDRAREHGEKLVVLPQLDNYNKGDGSDTQRVCGCPLTPDLSLDTAFYCPLPKDRCLRHCDWEKLTRAELELERIQTWLKLDELLKNEQDMRLKLITTTAAETCPDKPVCLEKPIKLACS